MSGLFADNPCYVKHETQLKQLHQMMAEGNGDSEEADALRDEMDTTWWPLTAAECKRVSGLSADLYMLQDDEVFEPADGRTQIQIGQAIYAAIDRKKWEEALALMRKPNIIPKDQIAAFRAKAYDELGHYDTALLFLNYRIEHSAERGASIFIKFVLASRSGYNAVVVPIARKLLAQTSLTTFQRATVAYMLARAAQYLPELQARSIYIEVISKLEQVLLDKTSYPADNETLSIIHLFIGYCYFMSGDIEHTRLAYEDAQKLDYDSGLEQFISHLSHMNPDSSDDRDSFASILDAKFNLSSAKSNEFAAAA